MPKGIYKHKGGIKHLDRKSPPSFTKEHREKISEALKGENGYWFGKKLSEEHKRKISKAHKDKSWGKHTEEYKKKMSEGMIGDKNPAKRPEVKKKISEAHKGKKLSEEHKKKIGITQKGEKSHFWKGGISFEIYSVDWTETLRRAIRERDHYICQLCSGYGNTVHHINYDKKNCNPNNLITLCQSCNVKVNANRNYWTQYFYEFRKKEGEFGSSI